MTNTTATLAAALDTTPRTLRKFLRSSDLGVGRGRQYALPSAKREVNKLAKQFATWNAAQVEAKAARAEAPAAPAVEVIEVADEEAVDFDDLQNPMDA